MKHNIISIGELLWDMLPDKSILGGAPANLTFRLKELGEECYLISKVGNDTLGRNALQILKSMGLSTSFIQIDEKFPTGTVHVSFDEHKNPDYIIIPDVAYDHIELTDEIKEIAMNADCIIFGTLAQRSSKTRETIAGLLSVAQGAIKFLDVNLRKKCYTTDTVEESLYYTDILKINHHEAYEIDQTFSAGSSGLPGIANALSKRFHIDTILITLSDLGVFLFDRKEGEHYIPGNHILLKDPLGAGDAFSAGFIHRYLKQNSLIDACIFGNQLGAYVATTEGATAPIVKGDLDQITGSEKYNLDHTLVDYRIKTSGL